MHNTLCSVVRVTHLHIVKIFFELYQAFSVWKVVCILKVMLFINFLFIDQIQMI